MEDKKIWRKVKKKMMFKFNKLILNAYSNSFIRFSLSYKDYEIKKKCKILRHFELAFFKLKVFLFEVCSRKISLRVDISM